MKRVSVNFQLSNTDNQKNTFLILGEGPTDGINGSTGAAEKTPCILSLYYSGNESYLYVNKTDLQISGT